MYYPMMVVSLCLCDREFFAASFWAPAMESLLKGMSKLKLVALDLIHLLLEVCLNRFITNEAAEALNVPEKLQALSAQLFPAKKLALSLPTQPQQQECIDKLAELISVISKTYMDFACRHIIFELLKSDAIIPEYFFR